MTVYKNGIPSQMSLASFTNIISSKQETDYSVAGPKEAVLDALQRLGEATMPDIREFIAMNGHSKGRRRSIAPTLSVLKKTGEIAEAGSSNGLILYKLK